MPVDVETQLAALGAAWNSTVGHVEVAEIVGRSSDPTSPPVGALDDRLPRRPRWLLAACAALVVALVGAIALFRLGDDDQSPVDTVTSTTIATTTTTSLPENAAGTGDWVPTGRLAAGCAWCGTVVLEDGRVVITGATDADGAIVQVYDPSMATFTTAARLSGSAQLRNAAVLDDGRVLMSGISGDLAVFEPSTGTIESLDATLDGLAVPVVFAGGRILLFDAVGAHALDATTGAVTPAGDMAARRNDGIGMVAVPLQDGTVLVAGTSNDGPTAEIYDPTTGRFAPTGPTHTIVDAFTATLLLDGRVLIAGGVDRTGTTVADVEIFDPMTGVFTSTDSMRDARFWHTAARLSDGRVLIAGGTGGNGVVETAEIYDPATERFTPAPAPTGRRVAATAQLLPDNNVLLLGNYAGNGGDLFETDATTAEILAVGDLQLPPGCCVPNPRDLTFNASLEPDDWSSLSGRPLHARMVVPDGGLRGAVNASYIFEELHGDGQGSGFGGDVTLPTDCENGCELIIPLDFEPTDDQQSVDVTVVITYDGSPPAAANEIAITIEPADVTTTS